MIPTSQMWKPALWMAVAFCARPALGDQGVAYALITDGSLATVSAEYSFNPGGGAITAARTGTGQYSVTFPNAGIGGTWNAQAAAYGPGSNYCNIGGWGENKTSVECYNPGGAAADSPFTVLAISSANDRNIAFAWANNPKSASYTPNGGISYNPGGAITVTRSATGTYTVAFAGLNGTGGDVQVNALGSNASCYSAGWTTNFTASVDCADPTGAPVDSQFVVYAIPSDATPPAFAYSLADQDASATYTPNTEFTYSTTGNPVKITRSSPGQYVVTFAGMDLAQVRGGSVRATSYLSTARCNVQSWTGSAAAFEVAVGCFSISGAPMDAEYEVLALRPMGYAYADIDTNDGQVAAAYSLNPGGAAITATRISPGFYRVFFPHSGIGPGANA